MNGKSNTASAIYSNAFFESSPGLTAEFDSVFIILHSEIARWKLNNFILTPTLPAMTLPATTLPDRRAKKASSISGQTLEKYTQWKT